MQYPILNDLTPGHFYCDLVEVIVLSKHPILALHPFPERLPAYREESAAECLYRTRRENITPEEAWVLNLLYLIWALTRSKEETLREAEAYFQWMKQNAHTLSAEMLLHETSWYTRYQDLLYAYTHISPPDL